MLRKLNKFSDVLNYFYTGAAMAFLAYCIFAICLQVIARYVFNASQSWTEETARHSFIWTNILGATVAYKHGSHAAMDLLKNLLPACLVKVQSFILRFLVLFCALIMVTEGVKLVGMSVGQWSPAVRIPMQYIFVSVPIGGFAIFVHASVDILNDIQRLLHKNGPENTVLPGKEA